MRQIIPFKKDLLFKTKVSEITSISLEHSIAMKNSEKISGEFHITGDYKMTEASINRENFNFKIPFDIELDSKYVPSTLSIDIDNFYYEVVNNESLQVNIDLYIEGEKEKEKEEVLPEKEEKKEEMVIEMPPLNEEKIDTSFFPGPKSELQEKEERKEEIIPEIMTSQKNTVIFEDNHQEKANHQEFNLFENIDNSDTYITYYVYIVKEQDTIDSIMEKYHIDKETISLYNNLEEIKPGTKLIIPNKNE